MNEMCIKSREYERYDVQARGYCTVKFLAKFPQILQPDIYGMEGTGYFIFEV